MNSLRNFLSDIKTRMANHGRDVWLVNISDAGFSLIKNGREMDSVRWDDVISVDAYKSDQLTHAVVSLAFGKKDGTTLVVDELVSGFENLTGWVDSKLPKHLRNWRTEVEKGEPFAQNRIRLWP